MNRQAPKGGVHGASQNLVIGRASNALESRQRRAAGAPIGDLSHGLKSAIVVQEADERPRMGVGRTATPRTFVRLNNGPMSLGTRRRPLDDLHVRLELLLQLLSLLPECPLTSALTAFLDGDDDRRLTEFCNSQLDPAVRHAIDATRQAVSDLRDLDPQISLATLPSLIGRLSASAPAKVGAVRHSSAPRVVPRPSLPADARNRHLVIGNAISRALEPLVPLLPRSARQIWRRHRPTENVRLEKSSKRRLKGVDRVAEPLRAKIEKWMEPITETLIEHAALLGVPTEEPMGIDEIARIPEHRNASQDAFAMPVFLDRRAVDDGSSSSTARLVFRSRGIRLLCRNGPSWFCRD